MFGWKFLEDNFYLEIMMKFFTIIFLFLLTSRGFATSIRSIDIDQIKSSDHTKTFTLPASSGALLISGNGTIPTTALSGTSTYVLYFDPTGFGGTDSAFTFNDVTKTLNATNITGNIATAGQEIRDAFTGNSSTTAFTLSFAPPSATTQVKIFQDGILMTYTDDYTISSTTLTMTTAPSIGQKLLVIYSRY
jgi:uncharacterized protein involved in outer membrane biogenesis